MFIVVFSYRILPGCWQVLSPTRKETSSEACQGPHDFNHIETRAVTKLFFFVLQGKAPKQIHALLTETLSCFLPGRAKNLSAPLYKYTLVHKNKSHSLVTAICPYITFPVVVLVTHLRTNCYSVAARLNKFRHPHETACIMQCRLSTSLLAKVLYSNSLH